MSEYFTGCAFVEKMVSYTFQVAHLRPAVAIVSAHGATDLATLHWPPIYATCCLIPLPSHIVTGLFVISSLIHFAEDIGRHRSLALHSFSGIIWLLSGAQHGLEFMLGYLTLLHTPCHYLRCWNRHRWCAMGVSIIATFIAMALLNDTDVVIIDNAVQRIVIAHIYTEHLVEDF